MGIDIPHSKGGISGCYCYQSTRKRLVTNLGASHIQLLSDVVYITRSLSDSLFQHEIEKEGVRSRVMPI